MHLTGTIIIVLAFVSYEVVCEQLNRNYLSVYNDRKIQKKTHMRQNANKQSWLKLVERRQEDEDLIKYIRKQLVSPTRLRARFVKGSLHDTNIILNSTELSNKTNGFFVEVAANDGITNSRTIPWEVERDWTGVLIEANVTNYKKLARAGRRAYTLNGCVCRSEWTEKMYFSSENYYSLLDAELSDNEAILCYPLYSVLAALNVTVVHLAVISVSGWELEVLQTIPFEEVLFLFVVVDYNTLDSFQHLQSFMESRDYHTLCRLPNHGIFSRSPFAWIKSLNMTDYPGDMCLEIFDFPGF